MKASEKASMREKQELNSLRSARSILLPDHGLVKCVERTRWDEDARTKGRKMEQKRGRRTEAMAANKSDSNGEYTDQYS